MCTWSRPIPNDKCSFGNILLKIGLCFCFCLLLGIIKVESNLDECAIEKTGAFPSSGKSVSCQLRTEHK